MQSTELALMVSLRLIVAPMVFLRLISVHTHANTWVVSPPHVGRQALLICDAVLDGVWSGNLLNCRCQRPHHMGLLLRFSIFEPPMLPAKCLASLLLDGAVNKSFCCHIACPGPGCQLPVAHGPCPLGIGGSGELHLHPCGLRQLRRR